MTGKGDPAYRNSPVASGIEDSSWTVDLIDEYLDNAEQLAWIRSWVRCLSGKDRVIAEMRMFGRKMREIAEYLGVSNTAVQQRWRRILNRIREDAKLVWRELRDGEQE